MKPFEMFLWLILISSIVTCKKDSPTQTVFPDYDFFPASDAIWEIHSISVNPPTGDTSLTIELQYLDKDTIMITTSGSGSTQASRNYIKVNYTFTHTITIADSTYTSEGEGNLGFIRVDKPGKKIFKVGTYNEQGYINGSESLIYDFDLRVGDTFTTEITNGFEAEVTAIENILIGDKIFKQFQLDNFPWDSERILIEGVGNRSGLLKGYDRNRTLVSFRYKGRQYYP